MLRLLLRKALFATVQRAPAKHEPLAQRGDLVLVRSEKDPGVRRWRKRSQQRKFWYGPRAWSVLREAFDGGGTVHLTRTRLEQPEVRELVDHGLLEVQEHPAHYTFEFRGTLTPAGRAEVKRVREARAKAGDQAQVGMFKGGVRILLKSVQGKLFGATAHVSGHVARNPSGVGTHFVHEHDQRVTHTATNTAHPATSHPAPAPPPAPARGKARTIPKGEYRIVGYEDLRPFDWAAGKRLPGREEDAQSCSRCEKKHWRIFHVHGPEGRFTVGQKCAGQMLEGFDPMGEQLRKMRSSHEAEIKAQGDRVRKAFVEERAGTIADRALGAEVPEFHDLGVVEIPASKPDGASSGRPYSVRRYALGETHTGSSASETPWTGQRLGEVERPWTPDEIESARGAWRGKEAKRIASEDPEIPENVRSEVRMAASDWATWPHLQRKLRKAAPGGTINPMARGLRLMISKSDPRVKRWKRGEEAKPPTEHVRYRHPDTGDERTGQVVHGGAKGVTVVDHETGHTAKVEHGHYVVSDPPSPAQPSERQGKEQPAQQAEAPKWRERFPGLNKYPPKDVEPEIAKGDESWKLRWRSPKTGKMVQAYETAFLRENARGKFRRINAVGQRLPGFRAAVAQHLDQHPESPAAVKTAMARIVDRTAMRAGNEGSAKEDVFGVSTLRKEHVKVHGDTVSLSYVGKADVPQEHEVRDPKLAAVIKHLLELPGDRLFQARNGRDGFSPITADQLNEYVAAHLGEDHTLKDLRTFHATRLFSEAADKLGPPSSPEDAEKKIQQAALEVAQHLGHKRAIKRGHFAVHAPGQDVDHDLVKRHGGKLYMHGERRSVGFHAAKDQRAYMKAATGSTALHKDDHPEVGDEWVHEGKTSLDNYIDPTVVEAYRRGLTLSGSMAKAVPGAGEGVSADERRFIDFLGRVDKMDPYKFRGGAP